jgi:hypothetical protein
MPSQMTSILPPSSALCHLTLKYPGKPHLVVLIIHETHGILVRKWCHFVQAVMILEASPHLNIWACQEAHATRREHVTHVAVAVDVSNVFPRTCLITFREVKTWCVCDLQEEILNKQQSNQGHDKAHAHVITSMIKQMPICMPMHIQFYLHILFYFCHTQDPAANWYACILEV